VVTIVAAISDTSQIAKLVGSATVHLAAEGGNASGLFVGIGPATEVDRYLAGVAIDQATDFRLDPYALSLSRREGVAAATPPAHQTFWVMSRSAGGGADVTWRVRNGDYRPVVMNSDGSPGVTSQMSTGIGLSGIFGVSLATLIGGLVLLAAGIFTLLVGLPRRARPSGAGAPPATSAPG
jgi:hypothetical protein